jgi:ubiquinone/menaquinone biosynthesis C-methylase UbiE
VLPFLGGTITGHRNACEYLPASFESFVEPGRMMDELAMLGMQAIVTRKLTGGVAKLYLARR